MSNSATQAIERVKAFKMPHLGKFGGLMKREFLDHKTGFFIVPGVIAAFMVVLILWGTFYGNAQFMGLDLHELQAKGEIDIDGVNYGIDKINSMDLHSLKRALGIAMWALSVPILMIIPFVVVFGLLGSLYDDRRDRSYLFWKSMPVSDTQEVLAKLFAVTVMGPACIIGFAAVVQVFAMIVGGLWGAAYDIPIASFAWNNAPTLSLWLGMVAHQVVGMIWALPVLGWLLLVSSYATRAPLLVAAVPIAGVITLEGIFNHTAYFAEWLGTRLGGFAIKFEDGNFEPFSNGNANFPSPFIDGAWDRLADGMATADFWVATAIGVALIAGAIQMRRYNV